MPVPVPTFGPIVGEIVAVKHYVADGQQGAIMTSHWQVSTLVTGGASWQETANAFRNMVLLNLPPLLANTATYRGAGVKSTNPINANAEAFGVNSPPVAGTGGAVGLPKQTAGLFATYDGLAGKSHRGRMYVPFPAATSNVDPGVPSALYLTNLGTFSAEFLTSEVVVGAGGTTTFSPVIYHKTSNTGTAVTSVVTRARWATQKRRGDYGRTNVLPI